MTDQTNILGLPYLAASQSQKHVTHNEALRALDAAVQVGVISTALTAPPVSPAEGDRYIVAASPTGAWTGWAGRLAYFADGAWYSLTPRFGWLAFDLATDTLLRHNGTAWVGLVSPLDSDLVTIAGLTPTDDDFLQRKAGAWANRTPAQVVADLPAFTSGAKGVTPASGGGTTNFLRADGTWAAPGGGGVSDGDKGDIIVSSGGTVWSADTSTIAMLAGTQTVTGDKDFSGNNTLSGNLDVTGLISMGTDTHDFHDFTDPTKTFSFKAATGQATATALVITMPAVSSQLIGTNSNATAITGAWTFTTGSLQIRDGNLSILGSADQSKVVKIEADGLTTGTTRTLTAPDASGTLVLADATQTLTNKSIAATQLTGTLQAAQEPAHTGDVTNTAGSLALTIAANAVTNAKMATMADLTVKANLSGATAVPSDIGLPLFLGFANGYGSTVSSAGSTTLTVASAKNQVLTGTTTHTHVLPTAGSVTQGFGFIFQNQSTGAWTINANNGSLAATIAPGEVWMFVCSAASGAGAAAWDKLRLLVGSASNSQLATMAANTVKANATNGSATPTDVAIGASQLFGRGATGDLTAVTLGTNLSFSGTTLNAAGGSGSPGGSTTQVQWNNGGAFAGAAEVEIENDQLRLEETTSFTAPAANGVKLIAVERDAKNSQPAWLDAAGVPIPLMGDLYQIGGMGLQAIGGANSITAFGTAAPSAVGTATAFTPTTASLYTKTPVHEWLVTTASTTAIAGFRTLNGMLTVGGASAGKGGFYWFGRFGPATGVATATNRCVFGLRALTSAPTDAQPSNQVSCAFFGWDDTDTNMQFMSNDASGTCTKVDLGASFPVPSADRTKTFDCWMYSPPGTTLELYWRIQDRASGAVASGVVTTTTDLPASSTRLSPTGWCSVGGTSSVIGFGLHAMNWRPIVVD